MTEKRFYIKNERTIKDTSKYVTDTGYVFSYKSDAAEVCDLLNKFDARIKCYKNYVVKLADENKRLKETNQGLQTKILSILDYIKEKETITRTEFTDYWNNEVMKE